MDFFPTNFILHPPHQEQEDHHHHPHPSSNPSSQLLSSWNIPHDHSHGLGTTLLGKRSPSIPFHGFDACERLESPNGGMMDQVDDLSEDDGSSLQNLGENRKKIRLNMEQVRALEKSFESGNKLDPERKLQLARALELQPRQVAIWFQNRRARWKTKQLEKDYDLLKRQFDSVKADNDSLQTQNQKLHEEIMALKGVRDTTTTTTHYELPLINLNKLDPEGCGSNMPSRESSSDILKLNSTRPNNAIEPDHDHHQNPVIISRQLFPNSVGFGNGFGGIGNDHHQLGMWPWFEQQQQQQHLS